MKGFVFISFVIKMRGLHIFVEEERIQWKDRN